MKPGQTVIYTTKFDTNKREGIIQEVTEIGYMINNVWYGKNDINIIKVLLDSHTDKGNKILINE